MTETGPSEPIDAAKKDAITRLFGYAEHHLERMREEADPEKLRFCFDHFLLCVSAAVNNLQEALGGNKKGPFLNAPSIDSATNVPGLAPIHWAWCARNSVAHDYLLLFKPSWAELAAGDLPLEIGGSPYWLELPLLQPVFDKADKVAAPEIHPVDLADLTLRFWRSVYTYTMCQGRVSRRISFEELWNNFCKK